MSFLKKIFLGSWTYETEKLDMLFVDDRASVDLAEYTPSNEWYILDAPAFKNTKEYNSKNYTDLTFYIVLRRNGGFYSYILILPCVLLAVLTMVCTHMNFSECVYNQKIFFILRLCFGFHLNHHLKLYLP